MTGRPASDLSVFHAWARGAVLDAGQCLLSPEPIPRSFVTKDCGECNAVIVGCSDRQLTERHWDHRRRCHSGASGSRLP